MLRTLVWEDRRRYPAERDRVAVCEWLHRHGIDPSGVSIPTQITCDDAARRIVFTSWGMVPVPVPLSALRAAESRGPGYVKEMGLVSKSVQLEAPALPFPVLSDPGFRITS